MVELAACTAAGFVGMACLINAAGVGMQPAEADPQQPNMINILGQELHKARSSARQIKDAAHVRGIHQALVIFANNNQDQYPLPSALDIENATVALGEGEDARSKDLTNHIFSMLIFQGSVSPELCVSPAETNDRIRIDKNYSYDTPAKAAKPEDALWDPAFAADFTAKVVGNFSYGHIQTSDGRLKMWTNTFDAREAVLGNRGPEVDAAGIIRGEKGNVDKVTTKNEKSKTFGIHGGPNTWEGNIAFNDNHVDFLTTLKPPTDSKGKAITYNLDEKGEKKADDVLFYDETDAYEGTNIFLGIFTKAGKKPEEFHAIWD